VSDYPAITGIAAFFGWIFWFLGFSQLGERLRPNRDNHSWAEITAFLGLGAISIYPMAVRGLASSEGQIWSRAIEEFIWLYVPTALFGFVSGFGLFRLWIRVRHGKESLAADDASATRRRYMTDLDYIELQHGPKAEELRIQRAEALSNQFEADASKLKN
jgi:hypothetical protein